MLGRQYGLILPKKAQKLHPVLHKPSVFGNDPEDNREPVAAGTIPSALVLE